VVLIDIAREDQTLRAARPASAPLPPQF
jgi:hypothetical protein